MLSDEWAGSVVWLSASELVAEEPAELQSLSNPDSLRLVRTDSGFSLWFSEVPPGLRLVRTGSGPCTPEMRTKNLSFALETSLVSDRGLEPYSGAGPDLPPGKPRGAVPVFRYLFLGHSWAMTAGGRRTWSLRSAGRSGGPPSSIGDEAAGLRLRGRQGGCFRVSLNRPRFLETRRLGFTRPRWGRARDGRAPHRRPWVSRRWSDEGRL